jgi:hypothetical protein
MHNKFVTIVSRICHSAGMPVCPSEEDMPEVDFDFCEPEAKLSEIKRVLFSTISGGEFEDWSNADEWNFRMSYTSEDRRAIRAITCIADKPQPNSIKKQLSNDRRKITSKTHTINVTVDESTQANHEFIKTLKKGKKLRVWYETMGGRMFGGNSGIIATVFGDMILNRGQGEIQLYQIEVIWETIELEPFIESPIFNDPAIACAAITGLELSDITASSIVATWDDVEAIVYEYNYNTTGVTPTTWLETYNTTVTISGLVDGTEYFVFVRAKCTLDASGEPSSESATTDFAPPALPEVDGNYIVAKFGYYGVDTNIDDEVTQWNDLSGYDNHTVPISDKPMFIHNAIGSKGIVRFTSVGDTTALKTAGDMVGLTGKPACTLFFVAKFGNPLAALQVVAYTEDLGGLIAGEFETYINPEPNVAAFIRGNAGFTNGKITAPVNDWKVYMVDMDFSKSSVAELKMTKNDSAADFTLLGSNENTNVFIAAPLTIGVASIDIAAVIMVDTSLNNSDKTLINNYLQTLFSIV